MSYSNSRLNDIYDKTGGLCACCGKQLAFKNYGNGGLGRRGRWEVAHGKSRVNGGSDELPNLWAMCFDCNRSMGPINARQYCGT